MVKKVGICWHFETIQTSIRLDVSTDTNFFAVFRVNLLKFEENYTIFDQKRSFVHCFD